MDKIQKTSSKAALTLLMGLGLSGGVQSCNEVTSANVDPKSILESSSSESVASSSSENATPSSSENKVSSSSIESLASSSSSIGPIENEEEKGDPIINVDSIEFKPDPEPTAGVVIPIWTVDPSEEN